MNRVNFTDKSVAFFAIELTVIDFKIEKFVQSNVNNQHNKIVIQTIKWCNHCQKFYHIDVKCHVLHFHLKVAADKRKIDKKNAEKKTMNNVKTKKKQKQKNKFKKKSWKITNAIAIKTHSTFANVVFSKLIDFNSQISVSVILIKTLNFLSTWLLDIEISYHMTHDRFFFTNFKVIFDTSIKEIKKQLFFFDYKTIRFFVELQLTIEQWKFTMYYMFLTVNSIFSFLFNCNKSIVFFSSSLKTFLLTITIFMLQNNKIFTCCNSTSL